MTTVTTKVQMKVAAVVAGLAMATSMLAFAPMAQAALTSSQVTSILSLLASFGADASTISNVQASLTGGTPVATPATTTGTCTFTRDLYLGVSNGDDIKCVQKTLIAAGYVIPAGVTGVYGSVTKAQVAKWQLANNLPPAVGFFGTKSRALMSGGSAMTPVTPGTPITGNGLKVMLATDSPNGVALVAGQAIGTLAKFTFSNPTSASINVTNVSFKRIGVSNDATLANVYLYSGAKRLTDSAGISSSAFNFNDPTGLFTVAAGGTYTVSVLADITTGTSGQQVGAQLTAVTSSGTLDSSVSFPVSGGTQTVSAATLATVDFANTALPALASVSPANDVTVWQNTVTISTRAVTLSSFQLKNIGSIAKTDINNLRLYVDGVQVGTASTLMTDSQGTTVNWDLSASPKRLETGGRVIKVVGDVVGGSSLTFKLSLQRGSDAMMIDTDLNQAILATYLSGTAFAARASGVQTVSSGTISVVKAANSPASNVSLGGTNIKFASFELRAAGEDIKVDNLTVQATAGSVGIIGLQNGKVFLNGVQVGSTKNLTNASPVNFTFGSSMILKAGTTAIVDIYADAKSSTGAAFTSGDTAVVQLSTGADNGTGQVSLTSINVPGSNQAGTTLTVTSSSMTLTKSSGYGNQTMIAGTSNARLGSFVLSSGSTEGVSVNTITVTLSANESASITDLMLKNAAGTTIGTAKASPGESNSFSVDLTVAASATQVIDVFANIKSGANAGSWIAAVDGSGTGAVTGTSVTFGNSTTATLQTITLASGTLTTALGVSPNNANVIAGTEVKVGSFLFTAQYSNFTVQEVRVKVPADAATSVASVILKKGATVIGTQALALSSGAQTDATSTFTGLSFVIAQNTSETLDVYVTIPTIASGASTGKAITVTLDANEGFKAVDAAGNATTTLTGGDLSSVSATGKGTMYVRKSVPTFSAAALPSSTLADGSNKVIGKFTVTADANGAIGWKYLSFTMTKTANVLLGSTSTIALYEGSNVVAGKVATTTANGGAEGQQSFLAAVTSGFIVFEATTEQQVAAGTSVTYELRTTVSGVAANMSLDLSLANPTTTIQAGAAYTGVVTFGASTPSIVWTDRSSISTVHSEATTDWTNDYLIKTLQLTVGNLVRGA